MNIFLERKPVLKRKERKKKRMVAKLSYDWNSEGGLQSIQGWAQTTLLSLNMGRKKNRQAEQEEARLTWPSEYPPNPPSLEMKESLKAEEW